jgi:nucleoside phosphorylase
VRVERGRSPRLLGPRLAGRLHEPFGVQDLPVEVAWVERRAPDNLVHPPKFAYRELLAAEHGRECRVLQPAFAPDVAMFVGIAGGLKDVEHGDVVAADAVYDYETGKDGGDAYLARIKTTAPSFPLVQRARAVARSAEWQTRVLPHSPERHPSAFVKPIAAGSKIVGHDRSRTAQLLYAHCGDAVAVDMESCGFLHGAYVNEGVATLVVRGISDRLRDKSEDNDRRWQLPAARNAAAFAFEVLDTVFGPAGPDSRAAGVDTGQTGATGPSDDRWTQVNAPAAGGMLIANQGQQTVNINPSASQPPASKRRFGRDTKVLLATIIADVGFFYGMLSYTGRNTGPETWRAIIFLVMLSVTIAMAKRWVGRRF